MNRHTIFGSPYLLGFEHLERLLERTAKRPANPIRPTISKRSEDGRIRITLAVAGFAKEELSVTEEDHQLVVRGGRRKQTAKRSFTAALRRDNFCAASSWRTASKFQLPRWKMDC